MSKEALKKCAEENGLNEDFCNDFEASRGQHIDDSKCFFRCLLASNEFLDSDDHLQVERFKDSLKMRGKDKLVEALDHCPEVHEKIDCDSSRALLKCLFGY